MREQWERAQGSRATSSPGNRQSGSTRSTRNGGESRSRFNPNQRSSNLQSQKTIEPTAQQAGADGTEDRASGARLSVLQRAQATVRRASLINKLAKGGAKADDTTGDATDAASAAVRPKAGGPRIVGKEIRGATAAIQAAQRINKLAEARKSFEKSLKDRDSLEADDLVEVNVTGGANERHN